MSHKELTETEKWLEHLDPHTAPARDARHLRHIRVAADAFEAAKAELDEAKARLDAAVGDARAHGDSWGLIGMVLGVSRQAAQQRFADVEHSDRGLVTQRVTAKDIEAGRIRLPAASKRLLPSEREDIDVVLNGTALQARWDPRNGPDRPRTGVLSFGRGRLGGGVDEHEVLRVQPGAAGGVELTSQPG